MTGTVHSTQHKNVAILTLDNPPVNALGAVTRQSLQSAFRRALADDEVRAIVITAQGKLFSAGADIAEFKGDLAEPGLAGLLAEIEGSTKPLIAAIHGTAMGGGLELALVCHYRITVATAQLALPEVNIGIIPGAGGTQRLPRLIGIEPAIEIITSGKPISAREALIIRLVDSIIEAPQDVLRAAIAFAEECLAVGRAPTNARNIALAEAPKDPNFFAARRAALTKSSRGAIAPLRALDAVQMATRLPLQEGLKQESEIFSECNCSPQARALQHLFFAERRASQAPGIDHVDARPLHKIGVVGAGTMGGGIAMNFLNAGIPVTILDLSGEALERGLATVRKNYDISVSRGRISAEEADKCLALLTSAQSYESLADADLVIEAVFENMDVKKKVFAALDRVTKSGAILATNTSTLNVDHIAAVTSRPHDVIGLHFFSPANVMRLVEIVRGKQSAPDAVKTALAMCKRIRKIGVVVGVCFGFVGNRMLEPYSREAHRLLLEGATPELIDRALTKHGLSMGIFAMYDLAGVDVGALVRRENRAAIAHDPSYCRIGDLLAERGENGQKTGRGFYTYTGRERTDNPELPALIEQESSRLGISRRDISEREIVERCLFPLIDEGLRILEEGIAQRPGDIDIVWCNGYGYPALLGGPMHWADEYGPDRIWQVLDGYRRSLGLYGQTWFKPSASLEKIARQGSRVADYFQST
jgi:3-hydroxyacyl-CoA dehydrogenase